MNDLTEYTDQPPVPGRALRLLALFAVFTLALGGLYAAAARGSETVAPGWHASVDCAGNITSASPAVGQQGTVSIVYSGGVVTWYGANGEVLDTARPSKPSNCTPTTTTVPPTTTTVAPTTTTTEGTTPSTTAPPSSSTTEPPSTTTPPETVPPSSVPSSTTTPTTSPPPSTTSPGVTVPMPPLPTPTPPRPQTTQPEPYCSRFPNAEGCSEGLPTAEGG